MLHWACGVLAIMFNNILLGSTSVRGSRVAPRPKPVSFNNFLSFESPALVLLLPRQITAGETQHSTHKLIKDTLAENVGGPKLPEEAQLCPFSKRASIRHVQTTLFSRWTPGHLKFYHHLQVFLFFFPHKIMTGSCPVCQKSTVISFVLFEMRWLFSHHATVCSTSICAISPLVHQWRTLILQSVSADDRTDIYCVKWRQMVRVPSYALLL